MSPPISFRPHSYVHIIILSPPLHFVFFLFTLACGFQKDLMKSVTVSTHNTFSTFHAHQVLPSSFFHIFAFPLLRYYTNFILFSFPPCVTIYFGFFFLSITDHFCSLDHYNLCSDSSANFLILACPCTFHFYFTVLQVFYHFVVNIITISN